MSPIAESVPGRLLQDQPGVRGLAVCTRQEDEEVLRRGEGWVEQGEVIVETEADRGVGRLGATACSTIAAPTSAVRRRSMAPADERVVCEPRSRSGSAVCALEAAAHLS